MSMKRTWIGILAGLQLAAAGAHAQKDWQFEVGPTAAAARANWQRLTQGEELARGKAVEFAPKPAYELTNDANDAYDLTDGKLSERLDDRIWFNKDAAGWHFGSGSESAGGVTMRIDLGSVQPVGQIAIRLLGGNEQSVLILPSAIEFLASVDGEKFYSLQRMKKLMPAERDQSNFKTGFFVPEEGKAFMHPFFCREAVRARYIAIRIMPLADVHTDQISVLKAAPGVKLNELTRYPESRLYSAGFVVKPKLDSFVVTTNAITPNWLLSQPYGKDAEGTNTYGLRLELPKGLRLLPESKPEFVETGSTATARRYVFKKIGLTAAAAEGRKPLFIATVPGEKVPAGAKAKFTGILNGVDSHTLEYPVQLVTIPEVPRAMTETFDIGLGWINEWEERDWPGYLQNLRKMGFGEVTAFPMWWGVKDGKMSPDGEKNLAFIREARQQGYDIVMQDSPFHEMLKVVQANAATLTPQETAELYNQPGGQPGKHLNPLYRGSYFQNEMKRIAELVSIVQPDQLHLDIELWWEAANEAKLDPRTIEIWKKSGKEWDDFITDAGTEMIGEVVKAARAASARPLKIGLYHSDPKNKVMDGVYDWNKLYPKYLDIAQPSLYVQGQELIVAERIRQNYNATGKRNIVPWLTGGTYGEFDPKHMETMVLETILNGASGITNYYYPDFDPMDFYYHARALATLGKFPTLMKTGKPIPFTAANKSLHYTCFSNGKEALLMVGNYGNSPNTKTTLEVPLKGAKKVVLVGGAALPVKNGQFALDVPAGQFRLVHLNAS